MFFLSSKAKVRKNLRAIFLNYDFKLYCVNLQIEIIFLHVQLY